MAADTHPTQARLLRFLRQCHAWIGLGGATFGLLFGVTGILLNHRSVLKLDVGRTEERKVQVALNAPPATPEALALTLQAQFGWQPERVRARTQPAKAARFQGAEVKAAEVWVITYGGHAHSARASYVPGNRSVEVEQKDAGLVDALKRMHKSEAGDAPWILVTDAFAGSLLFLSLSGVLLWTRLAGSRMLAAGLVIGGAITLMLVAARAW